MIIRIHTEDEQDFIIEVCVGSGGVAIETANFNKSTRPTLANFTIEEAQAIVGALNIAIKIALEE